MNHKTLAFVNLKGGTGKTTSTAFVSHQLATTDRAVLMVDADPQGSLLRWSESAAWAIPTIALPVRNLDSRLGGIVPPGIEIVVVDTPPTDDQRGITAAAIADVLVVPMAPTLLDFERLKDVSALIELERGDRPADAKTVVLLNRTVTNARSTRMYREIITELGHQVLESEVARREVIAQSFGSRVAFGSVFEAVSREVAELLELP
ncbi:ParA family protein [Rathayibacter sp. SD072]|uniref:ParA family protein n=1 Tax=Rathayibacter sp. SD072 TaxID=2781731 RepID=UPI001A970D64|nr:ParA family protein [Rathayibacter sp. SD072]MBO0984561.1 ParA family protein [Rathayibacter sp. SD072]